MSVHRSGTSVTSTTFIMLLAMSLCTAPAAALPIRITDTSNPTAVLPGELVTRVFRIDNLTEQHVDVALDVELPDGWVHLGVPDMLPLKPYGTEHIFVTFLVPPHVTGRGEIRVSGSTGGPEILPVTSDVVIADIYGVDLQAPTGRKTLAGREVVYRVEITNTGNRHDTFEISHESLLGWSVSTDPERVSLLPGEETRVTVVVAVPKGAVGTDTITLTAVSGGDAEEADSVHIRTQVAGTMAEPEPMYASLLASASVVYDVGKRTSTLSLAAGGDMGALGSAPRWIDVALQARDGAVKRASVHLYEGKRVWQLGNVKYLPNPLVAFDGVGVVVEHKERQLEWGAVFTTNTGWGGHATVRLGGLELHAALT